MSISVNKTISSQDVNTVLNNLSSKTNQATSSIAGIMKLFTSLGQNTDGAPTNKAVQNAINGISSASNGQAKVGKIIFNWGFNKRGNVTFGIPYTSSTSYGIVACQGQSLDIYSQYQNTGYSTRGTNTYGVLGNYSSEDPYMAWVAIGY